MIFLFSALLLFLGTEGTLITDDECSLNEACPSPTEPNEYPETAEDLKALCNVVIPFVTCQEAYFARCHPESIMLEIIQAELPVMRDICDEDSHFHDVIVSSLSCIKINRNEIRYCDNWPYDSTEIVYEKLIVSQGLYNVSITNLRCITPLFVIACKIAQLGRLCGQSLKEVAVEVMLRRDGPLANCGPEIFEKFPTIVDIVELNLMQNEELEYIFDEE